MAQQTEGPASYAGFWRLMIGFAVIAILAVVAAGGSDVIGQFAYGFFLAAILIVLLDNSHIISDFSRWAGFQ